MVSRTTKNADSQKNKPTKKLVIVESPSKVRNISSYLGNDYVVQSSVGHIRDLPRSASHIPARYKSEPWSRLGVNVDDDFSPLYVVSPDRKKTVTELKNLIKDADELLLATDGDREGEAIAWHLLEILNPKIPYKRMVFNEITKPAILAAAENPRDIDLSLVDAQETRRILDRLYGYEVSPVLWKKIMPKLSAGRVQSVATRIIVDREKERMAFTSAEYWDLSAVMNPQSGVGFSARLQNINGKRVATGKDFGADGNQSSTQAVVCDKHYAEKLAQDLIDKEFTVSSVENKPYTRKPYAPFITSTLQQEASRKLRFSSEQTMRTAQRLYENGFITYMRTDSTNLSQTALQAARDQVTEIYGAQLLSPKPRTYSNKVKNAQEAHEAIRPAGDHFTLPAALSSRLSVDEFKLYELIWQRTIASQMADAKGNTLSLKLQATTDEHEVIFGASGRTITFPGFLSAYVETVDDLAGGQADDEEKRLPELTVGQKLIAHPVTPEEHHTNPPPRYTEASLIKRMEELGIGRPSTYTSILGTIQARGYAHKKGSALVPSWVAFSVVELLENYFGSLVDYGFTAAMENDLDDIANGTKQRTQWLKDFYFGIDDSAEHLDGLKKTIDINLESIDPRLINSIHLFDDDQGRPIYVRVGRFGPYLEKTIKENGEETTQRANLPEHITPDELTLQVAEKLFAIPQEGRVLGIDPQTGLQVAVKEGRFSSYITEIIPEDAPEDKKPRTASLFKSMDPTTVSLDEALELLHLPRIIGEDPQSHEEITAQNGRYGPYLKKGSDSRSLPTEESIFTTSLDEALAIFAQPKTRGRSAATTAPLRELGIDKATDLQMLVKDGRFGPYVTDGKVNASLRKGDTPENITDDRAMELLAERRLKVESTAGTKKTTKAKGSTKTRSTKTTSTKAKKTTTRATNTKKKAVSQS